MPQICTLSAVTARGFGTFVGPLDLVVSYLVVAGGGGGGQNTGGGGGAGGLISGIRT